MSNLFENLGTVQDGINTLSIPQMVLDVIAAKELKVKSGDIDFKDVDFSYLGADKAVTQTVFNQLNFSIAAGEKVAIVGRSGAGKSTLINLLLRFFRPSEVV